MRIRSLVCALSATALLAAGASASSASAATVTVSPGGTTTFIGGASELILPTGMRTINCTSTWATATGVRGGTGSYPFRISNWFYFQFNFCTITGGLSITLWCGFPGPWYVDGPTITASSMTYGHVDSMSCDATLSQTCSMRVDLDSFRTAYDNSHDVLEIISGGQSIHTWDSTCRILPNDPSVILRGVSTPTLSMTSSPATTIYAY